MKKLVYQKFSSKSMLSLLLWIGLNLLKISLYVSIIGIIIYLNLFLSMIYPAGTVLHPLTIICLIISIVVGLFLAGKALKIFFSLIKNKQCKLGN